MMHLHTNFIQRNEMATRLAENGTDLRYNGELPGHKLSTTTKIDTPVSILILQTLKIRSMTRIR